MTQNDRITPALNRRAFFMAVAFALPSFAAQPLQKTTEYGQIGLPDAAKTREIVLEFQKAGIAGQYFLEFELRILPRRGDERVLQGKLWGDRNDQGAIS